MRNWLKEKRKLLVVAGIIILLVLFIVSFIGGYWFKWEWTGFRVKTEWDWLNLLGVLAIPVVVGLGATWYTAQQGTVSDRENKDNQREAALQTYIEKMSALLLNNGLRESQPGTEVRNIAQILTLTVLRRLDEERKGIVLQLLQDAGLIRKDKLIITLKNANLSGVKLRGGNLRGSNLVGANLAGAKLNAVDFSEANLSGAELTKAELSVSNFHRANLAGAHLAGADLAETNFSEAKLTGAFFSSADLAGANLQGAVGVTKENLEDLVKSLRYTTMPDGTKHQ
ncbi:MAG TPA: pentapeptide repeat-containing protein [Ktedonobacteraceae bacterium]|nr:pentapeptide repeat-containing protein [Ktedonobacteraceae bacterium]